MMASAQSARFSLVISDFVKLRKNVALELRTIDVETILSLLKDYFTPEDIKKEIRPREQNSGIRLFSCLHDRNIVSENNLDFLIELLNEANRQNLAERVKTYQAGVKSVNHLDTPSTQLSAMSKLVHFVVNIGGTTTFTNDNINHLKRSIGQGLRIKHEKVFFKSVRKLQATGYVDVTCILHTDEGKIDKLQSDALKKSDWLTKLGVQRLQVDKQSAIVIASDCQEACGQHACTRPSSAVQSILGNTCSADTTLHSNEMVDIILAIEVSWSINVNQCKSVVEQCDEAIHNFNSHKRISLITYGNHSPRKPSGFGLQLERIAIGDATFHEGSLSITDTVRERCGSQFEGNSGIADALQHAHGMAKKVRHEATRVCIMTCFVNDRNSNVGHYRCYHGIDPIKICHLLADCRVSLYIVGINCNGDRRTEDHFLSGITQITGGRYFEIHDIKHLRPVIEYILKESVSIEAVMGTVNDIVIGEINARYGDVNDVHLAEHLNHQLHQRNVKVEKIQNGMPLKPISKLSERVAWANDLDDAIEGVKRMTIIHNDPAELQVIQDIPKSHEDDPDMEVSTRMVMRQLHRSAYFNQ